MCIEQLESDIHFADFWLLVVIDKAVGLIETKSKSISSSSFSFMSLFLGQIFAMYPTTLQLDLLFSSLLSRLSLADLFLLHFNLLFISCFCALYLYSFPRGSHRKRLHASGFSGFHILLAYYWPPPGILFRDLWQRSKALEGPLQSWAICRWAEGQHVRRSASR